MSMLQAAPRVRTGTRFAKETQTSILHAVMALAVALTLAFIVTHPPVDADPATMVVAGP